MRRKTKRLYEKVLSERDIQTKTHRSKTKRTETESTSAPPTTSCFSACPSLFKPVTFLQRSDPTLTSNWNWHISVSGALSSNSDLLWGGHPTHQTFLCKPALSAQDNPTASNIVFPKLPYFHNSGKLILHLTPSIESFQQAHFDMYYSGVFKPLTGPERKCFHPASVTGYQPLIYYSTPRNRDLSMGCWPGRASELDAFITLSPPSRSWTEESSLLTVSSSFRMLQGWVLDKTPRSFIPLFSRNRVSRVLDSLSLLRWGHKPDRRNCVAAVFVASLGLTGM